MRPLTLRKRSLFILASLLLALSSTPKVSLAQTKGDSIQWTIVAHRLLVTKKPLAGTTDTVATYHGLYLIVKRKGEITVFPGHDRGGLPIRYGGLRHVMTMPGSGFTYNSGPPDRLQPWGPISVDTANVRMVIIGVSRDSTYYSR